MLNILSIILLLGVGWYSSPEPESITPAKDSIDWKTCETDNVAFSAGERLSYIVYYNWNFVWVPAGEIVLQVKEKGDQYHYVAFGRTYPSYEWFFKVRDRYECYANKSDLLPAYSFRDIHEGYYTRTAEAQFDYENRQINHKHGKSRDEMTKSGSYIIDDCMHDILSVFYYARNIDYEDSKNETDYPAAIFMDDEEFDITFRFRGKEKKKIKQLGKFRTLKITPALIAGSVFKGGDEMKIWASDDENKIPLLVESPVIVGSIKAVLKDYSGLKYDFTARIK